MIKVGVFYPNEPDAKFDMKYYLERHCPMVSQKMGSALKKIEVEQGLSGGAPGAPITYRVICHLTFDSVEAFQAAFAPHAETIMADIPKYTSLQPVIQISEVKI
jgi:uncharacterized protein (TIGR02118 family)